MASLSEVYERKQPGRGHASPEQVLLGVSLFLLGAAMIVVGLVFASTEILASYGVGRFEARRIAGILGGLGLPAVFIGILTVLPASRRLRAAAAVGAGIAVVGVAIFAVVYPYEWLGSSADRHYTFETTTIYFIGTLVTFWCFFVAAANFKTRNDPGGTVELEITKAGRTRVVEVDRSALGSGLGGIGLFGGTSSSSAGSSAPMTVSDGGETTQEIRAPVPHEPAGGDVGVDVITDEEPRPPPIDRYCGNCTHFRYVRETDGIQPYCGHHRETMSDMQPCEEWTPSREE